MTTGIATGSGAALRRDLPDAARIGIMGAILLFVLIGADPFLDGPAQPRLALLMLRDVARDDPAGRASTALTEAVISEAHSAGCKVVEVTAEAGPPIARLARQLAMVDYIATYLAIGTGIDPSVSPHVADLRDRTRDY